MVTSKQFFQCQFVGCFHRIQSSHRVIICFCMIINVREFDHYMFYILLFKQSDFTNNLKYHMNWFINYFSTLFISIINVYLTKYNHNITPTKKRNKKNIIDNKKKIQKEKQKNSYKKTWITARSNLKNFSQQLTVGKYISKLFKS